MSTTRRPWGGSYHSGLRFTPIELLVAIAIISILAPALSRARQQAKGTICVAMPNEMMRVVIACGNGYGFVLPPMRYEARPGHSGRGCEQTYRGWAEAWDLDPETENR